MNFVYVQAKFHSLILKLFGPQYSCVNKSTKDNRSRLIKTHNRAKVYAFRESNFGDKITNSNNNNSN